MAEGYAADLVRLYRVGKQMLPEAADSFSVARSLLLSTEDADWALNRPAEIGGPAGPAQSAIAALREQLARMLQETVDNLQDTGDVLAKAAVQYAGADDSVQTQFRQIADRQEVSLPQAPGGGR